MNSFFKSKIIGKLMFLLILGGINNSISAQSIGGTISGANNYCDTVNSGFLSVSGYSGTIVTWQYSDDNEKTWVSNGNSVNTQSYSQLKKPRCFRVIVKDGGFLEDTSTVACINIYEPTKAGVVSGGGVFCGNAPSGVLILSNQIGSVKTWIQSIDDGKSWIDLNTSTSTLTYPILLQNTQYKTIVQNSSFCLLDTTNLVSFKINALSDAGSIKSTASTTICSSPNSNTLSIINKTGNVLNWISSIDKGLTWTKINNVTPIHYVIDLNKTTQFAAIVQNESCLVDTSQIIKISVYTTEKVLAGNDTTIRNGQLYTLIGKGNGVPEWSSKSYVFNNPAQYNQVISLNVNTEFVLTVTDFNGCVNSDTVFIKVNSTSLKENICTVFSPNGDGINDSWVIKDLFFYPDNEVTVYNIYGNVVFKKKNYLNDWQGTYNDVRLPDGTYFYELKIEALSELYKGSLDILSGKK